MIFIYEQMCNCTCLNEQPHKYYTYLGVGNNTDNRSILLHLLKLHLNFLLASISVVLLSILGKSLLLALAPVLVEPSPHFLAKMLGPNRVERAETPRSLDVSHKTNNDKRRRFNDGNSLTGFLLMEFCRKSNRHVIKFVPLLITNRVHRK
jgi:hypothetical protein